MNFSLKFGIMNNELNKVICKPNFELVQVHSELSQRWLAN